MGLVLLLFAFAIGYLTVMACLKIRRKSKELYFRIYKDYYDKFGEDFKEERR